MKHSQFIRMISNLTPDGEENSEGVPFDMEGDDAVETLNGLIRQARDLVKTLAPLHLPEVKIEDNRISVRVRDVTFGIFERAMFYVDGLSSRASNDRSMSGSCTTNGSLHLHSMTEDHHRAIVALLTVALAQRQEEIDSVRLAEEVKS